MKKFIAAVVAALAIVLFGGITAPAMAQASTPAVASVKAEVTQSVSVSKVASTTSAPALATPQLNTGGIKPLSYWLPVQYCYWAMNGGYYCYRYGCTNFEIWLQGCYNGYVRMNPIVWV